MEWIGISWSEGFYKTKTFKEINDQKLNWNFRGVGVLRNISSVVGGTCTDSVLELLIVCPHF